MTGKRSAGVYICVSAAVLLAGTSLCQFQGDIAHAEDVKANKDIGVKHDSKSSDSSAGEMLCGPICFSIVLKRLGKDVGLDEAIKLTKTRGEGTTMLGLKRACEAKGLQVRGYKNMTPQDLLKVNTPAIVFVEGNHFMVVDGVKNADFIVIDYPKAPYLMPAEELKKIWKGEALIVSPAKTPSAPQPE